MVLSDLLAALLRRWYVLLAGLLATVALTHSVYTVTPAVYSARGLVVLLPSQDSVGPGGNPFLALSGLELPARLLVAYLDSASAQAQVAAVAPTATYDVTIEESTRGPVIAVDVSDGSPEGALATLTYIANEVSIQLERLQEQVDAPTDSEVTSMPLTIDTTAERDTSGAVRRSVAVLALGLVLSLLLTSAVDGLMQRRSRARRSDQTGPETVAAGPGPETEPRPVPRPEPDLVAEPVAEPEAPPEAEQAGPEEEPEEGPEPGPETGPETGPQAGPDVQPGPSRRTDVPRPVRADPWVPASRRPKPQAPRGPRKSRARSGSATPGT